MESLLTSIAETIRTVDRVAGVQVVLAAPPAEAVHSLGAAGFARDAGFRGRLHACRARGARLASFDEPPTGVQRVLPDRRDRMLRDAAWEPLHGYIGQLEWRDYVATPLPLDGYAGGVINCYLRPDAPPTARLLEFLRAMARVTAQAIEAGRTAAAAPELGRLTPRETVVLECLGEGLANREIGIRLGISERTARTHVSNLLAKLGVASRTQAALLAVRSGLV